MSAFPDHSAGSGFDATEIAGGQPPSGGLRTRLGRFYYHGKPIYLIQTGPYGARTDRGYDGRDPSFWAELIDRLASLQGDGVRFRLRIDPWAFCYDPDGLSPWRMTDGRWSLDEFDERFWSLIRSVADLAFSQDVLVEFVLFSAGTLRMGRGGTGWSRNPFNAAVGGTLTRDPAGLFYSLPYPDRYDLSVAPSEPSEDPQLRLQAAQERFIREATQRLAGLDNVSWEIASQLEGVDPVRIGFLVHCIELLRRVDPLDRVVTSSVRTLRRSDQELYRQVGIDTVQFRLNPGEEPHEELFETVTALRSFGKPVVAGEMESGPPEDDWSQRRALWQIYVAGGHPTAAGLVDRPEMSELAAFAQFVEDTYPGALVPDPGIVEPRTEGLHCHGGHADSDLLVLYLTAESPATSVSAKLRLAPGAWKAVSIDPASGTALEERVIEAREAASVITLPSFEQDLAVRLTRDVRGD